MGIGLGLGPTTKVAPLEENSPLVTVAHQLYAFLSVPGPAKVVLKQATQAVIERILVAFPPPTRISTFSTLGPAPAGNTRSTPLEEQPFPHEWAVDTPSVRKAIKAFENAIKDFEIPIQASARTPRSPKGTPTHSSSPSELSDFSCGQPRDDLTSPASASTVPSSTLPPTITNPSTRPTTSDGTIEMSSSFSAAPAAGLSNEQLSALVATAVATAMAQFQAIQPTATTAPTVQASFTPHFKARDLGYFEPDNEADPVENRDGKTIYHNVWSFTNRVRVKAASDSPETVRGNLDTCLLGKAERWYTEELNELSRTGLRNDPNGVQSWCDALETRFRESPGVSLARLETIKYTIRDVRARKDPEEYIQKIITNGRNSGLATTEYAQVLMAYQHMDGVLRMTLPPVTDSTTMPKFIEHINVQKANWFDVYQPFTRGDSKNDRDRRVRGTKGGDLNPKGLPYSQFPFQKPFYKEKIVEKEYKNDGSNNKQGPAIKQESRRDGSPKDQPRGFDKNRRFPFRPRNYLADSSGNSGKGKSREDPYNVDEYEEDYYGGPSYQYEDDGDENHMDEQEEYHEDTVEAHFTTDVKPSGTHQCKICKAKFLSKNRLHSHLRSKCISSKGSIPTSGQSKRVTSDQSKPISTVPPILSTPSIVRSTAVEPPSSRQGYGFKGFRYATAEARIGTPSDIPERLTKEDILGSTSPICLDTGCTMSLVDRNFLLSNCPNIKISTMATPMEVRGIGSASHAANQYALVDFCLPGNDGRIAYFQREVHLVDNLKANLLLGIDILAPEGIVMDLSAKIAVVKSCDSVVIPLSVETRSPRIQKTIFSEKRMIIPAHSRKSLPVRGPKGRSLDLPQDRDLLFEPGPKQKVSVFAHIVDHTMSAIYVQNDTDSDVTIPRNTRLGDVVEYEADGCFLATPEDINLAAKPPKSQAKSGWLRQAWKATLAAAITSAAVYTGMVAPPSTADVALPQEVKLPNGITVYGDNKTIPILTDVADAYPKLWVDNGNVANVPEAEWMTIPLVDNWQELYKPQARIYPVSKRDEKVIDDTFDKLHVQDRMTWTREPTPFTFPCFVVWKMVNGEMKGRVVIDIRALNMITLPDAYPVPSQADILAAVSGSKYITTIDCCKFFYHWRIAKEHRHRLTVASHRGQETFNVAVMGYRNSPAYVQRMIDRILRDHRGFSRAYVDDIVIFSDNLDEHVQHLHSVFSTLESYNLCLSPEKSFLGYPSIALLGQRVDALGLATAEEKLAAITKLAFPRTLRQLEHYLGLTGYLRQYIPYFAAIVRPLQLRKLCLNRRLRTDGHTGNARKRQAGKLGISVPTPREVEAFRQLQDLFARPSMLVHFSPKRRLYIDMDSSKEVGHGAYAYHAKDHDETSKRPPGQKSIEPILFLSRELTTAEKGYWPTELEVSGLVWVIRKLRHMVESANQPVVVFTDHSATCQIARQTSLNTVSIEKSNLKLIRSSEYLQRFRLDIRHRSGITNVIPDALSRLPRDTAPTLPGDFISPARASIAETVKLRLLERESKYNHTEEQSALYLDIERVSAHPVTLVQLSEDFKARLRQGYVDDPRWVRIRETLDNNQALGENAAELPYRIIRDLIYYQDPDQGRRLCIPQPLVGEVFRLAHDDTGHQGYDRTHQRLTEGLYIAKMAKQLREYIRHCPDCQLRQTPRHPIHGSLQPLLFPPRPFHTISIDFILALPISEEGYDCALSVTDKFSKAITLIPGKITWGGKIWAGFLLDRLCLMLWGLPRAILGDRDRRWIGQLWKGIFEALNVQLLYATAYHPQTDGQSERTNATVEIALRYYLATLPTMNQWPKILARMSHALANSTNFSSTGKTPTEVLHGFRTREALDFLRVEDGQPVDLVEEGQLGDGWGTDYANADDLAAVDPDVVDANPVVTRSAGRRQYTPTPGPAPGSPTTSQPPRSPTTSIPVRRCQPPTAIPPILPSPPQPPAADTLPPLVPNQDQYRPCQIDAKDAIAFAAMKMKEYYDIRHKPKFFKVGDMVNLRLHRGYSVPSITKRKIDQQFVGPFRVVERIGRLAYRLQLPPIMRIHPVISVAHLEAATDPDQDPFQRPRPQLDHPPPVLVEGEPEFAIDRLLRKRRIRRGRGWSTEYLVRWTGYGPEDDAWYNIKDLGNAAELVREFEERSEAEADSEDVLP